uniref:Uncharacterized protein n=1 Tax=viral metagenome TaxID=1070528 RepID=A0A6M3MAR3_9ZZZZ
MIQLTEAQVQARASGLTVFLIKPPVFNPSRPMPESATFERVVLKPYHYAKNGIPETVADIYTIYSPPQDREYEDWEIELMRKACEVRNLRFQLHPPPITVRRPIK